MRVALDRCGYGSSRAAELWSFNVRAMFVFCTHSLVPMLAAAQIAAHETGAQLSWASMHMPVATSAVSVSKDGRSAQHQHTQQSMRQHSS